MQVTIKGIVHALKKDVYNNDSMKWVPSIEYQIYPFEFIDINRAVIGEQEITVDIPDDYDIRTGLIASLEVQKQRLMAEFGKRVTEIESQINSLLALEA